MKRAIVAACALVMSSAAVAQTPPANPNPDKPPVATTNPGVPVAPAKGANSFTEAQAKSRIEAKGFTNVSSLKKDDDGIWRGKGMKGGNSLDVALDYQGNVFPQ